MKGDGIDVDEHSDAASEQLDLDDSEDVDDDEQELMNEEVDSDGGEQEAASASLSLNQSPLKNIDTQSLRDALVRLRPALDEHPHFALSVSVSSSPSPNIKTDARILGHSLRSILQVDAEIDGVSKKRVQRVRVAKVAPSPTYTEEDPSSDSNHSIAFRHLVSFLFRLFFYGSTEAERLQLLERELTLYVATTENRILDKTTSTVGSRAADEAKKLLDILSPVLDKRGSSAIKLAGLLLYAAENLAMHCIVCSRLRDPVPEVPGLCGNDLCRFQAIQDLAHADLRTELAAKFPGLRVLLASALSALEDPKRRGDLVYPVPPAYIRQLPQQGEHRDKRPRVDLSPEGNGSIARNGNAATTVNNGYGLGGPLDDQLARRGLAIEYDDLKRDLGELYGMATDPRFGPELAVLVASRASNLQLRLFFARFSLVRHGIPEEEITRAFARLMDSPDSSLGTIVLNPDWVPKIRGGLVAIDRLFVLAVWLCRLTKLHFREEAYEEGFVKSQLVDKCAIADLKLVASPNGNTKPTNAMVLRVWDPDKEDGDAELEETFMTKAAVNYSRAVPTTTAPASSTTPAPPVSVLLFHGSKLQNWLSLRHRRPIRKWLPTPTQRCRPRCRRLFWQRLPNLGWIQRFSRVRRQLCPAADHDRVAWGQKQTI